MRSPSLRPLNLTCSEDDVASSEGRCHGGAAPGPAETLPNNESGRNKDEQLDGEGRREHDGNDHAEEGCLSENPEGGRLEHEDERAEEDEHGAQQELARSPFCPPLGV